MMLDDDPHLKQPWQYALQWLQTELERVSKITTVSAKAHKMII